MRAPDRNVGCWLRDGGSATIPGDATGNRAAAQEAQACFVTLYDSPEFAPLRAHFALPPDRRTLEQLSDSSQATEGEIRLILDVHPGIQACRQQALDRVTQSTPSLVAIFATLYAKSDDSLIQLISKRQSWGEHTKQTRDLAIEGWSGLTAEAQRFTSELQQSHEAELAQRQAAAPGGSQRSCPIRANTADHQQDEPARVH